MNHLAGEKSPYLLQHAENPVDWYPWGDEAFGRARADNKPVFVSIGYATCHWCHVMAHESFEDLGRLFLFDMLCPGDLPGDPLDLLRRHVAQDPRGLVLAEQHQELGRLAVARVAAGFLDEPADAGVAAGLSRALFLSVFVGRAWHDGYTIDRPEQGQRLPTAAASDTFDR